MVKPSVVRTDKNLHTIGMLGLFDQLQHSLALFQCGKEVAQPFELINLFDIIE